MSKYSLDFDPGKETRLPEWIVTKDIDSARGVTIGEVIFHSTNKEEAEAFLEECLIAEQAAEWESFNNQQSEWDLYGDNAMEADYV